MDRNEFYTEEMEYKIVITKKKKFFSSLSEFGQYNCTIEFYNNLNLPILIVNCTELELYMCIQRLAEFNANIGMVNDDILSIIEFNSTGIMDNYIFVVATKDINIYPDYPTDQDLILSLSIYSSYMNNRALRLYFEMSYSFLDVLIYNIYLILEDLPYLDAMNDKGFEMIFREELQNNG